MMLQIYAEPYVIAMDIDPCMLFACLADRTRLRLVTLLGDNDENVRATAVSALSGDADSLDIRRTLLRDDSFRDRDSCCGK